MVLFGTCTDISKKPWGADVTIKNNGVLTSISYRGETADKTLAAADSLLSQTVMLSVSQFKTKEGKIAYRGTVKPTVYGFTRNTPELKITATDEDAEAVATAIEDAAMAGFIPEDLEVNFSDASSLADIAAILQKEKSNTVCANALTALYKLFSTESYAYLGKIGSWGEYNDGSVWVSFKHPFKDDEPWSYVTFSHRFKKGDKTPAEKVKSLKLNKGDRVFIHMGTPYGKGNNPTYPGLVLIKA